MADQPPGTPLPPVQVPADLEERLRRQEFQTLLAALKSGKTLKRPERDRLTELVAFYSDTKKPADQFIARLEAMGLNSGTEKVDGPGKELRLMAITFWLGHGRSSGWICQEAALRWGGSVRQTKRYVAQAWRLIQSDLNRERANLEGRIATYMERALELGADQNNPDVMLRSAEALARLFGLNKTKNIIEMSGPGGAPLAVFDVPDKE